MNGGGDYAWACRESGYEEDRVRGATSEPIHKDRQARKLSTVFASSNCQPQTCSFGGLIRRATIASRSKNVPNIPKGLSRCPCPTIYGAHIKHMPLVVFLWLKHRS